MQLSLFNIFGWNKKKSKNKRTPQRPKRILKTNKEKSNPELKRRWIQIREEFFPNRPDLDSYTVVWSNRPQKRTLASCSLDFRRIRVARELRYEQHTHWLNPLLYHEMCHAYLGFEVEKKGNKRAWHGKEFKGLENRHPQIKALDAWIKAGGWMTAVRSDRTKRYHQRKKQVA